MLKRSDCDRIYGTLLLRSPRAGRAESMTRSSASSASRIVRKGAAGLSPRHR